MSPEDEWLSPHAAAQRLGVSVSAIRCYIRAGRLPARRVRGSRLLRVTRADLDALLEPLPPRQAKPELRVLP